MVSLKIHLTDQHDHFSLNFPILQRDIVKHFSLSLLVLWILKENLKMSRTTDMLFKFVSAKAETHLSMTYFQTFSCKPAQEVKSTLT